MRKLFLLFILVHLTILTYAGPGDQLIGVWLTEEGNAKIKIEKSGNKYYGKIIWLEEPNNENGKPKTDKENPDEDKRNKPLIGLNLLKGFVWDADDNEWDNGTIYDPENGSTYDCYIVMEDNNTIRVRGYIGVSLLGRTTIWKRVS